MKRPLTHAERDMVAAAMVEHIRKAFFLSTSTTSCASMSFGTHGRSRTLTTLSRAAFMTAAFGAKHSKATPLKTVVGPGGLEPPTRPL